MSVTEQDGRKHEFSAGDVFFVPQGTVCSWQFTGNVSKFYCRVDGD
ncbi:MAG: cupin domain-containing protein [Paracoccaceae bacterium]